MDDTNYEIRRVTSWPTEEIVDLYREGGWWKEGYDPSGIPRMLEGSFRFVVAVERSSGRAVGMGRVISDGHSDGYIQDVVVAWGLRGKGLGRSIVRALLDLCLEAGLVWIGLIAEKGSSAFYRDMGFDTFDGEPMLYGGSD
ncbi:MAG: GNAT family N-acetyltransferase [Candidatus Thermoplasmatota archaeon]|nr:GNAT family N-acetyltransferase [Candidatus Thermoplasmatota archaeon]